MVIGAGRALLVLLCPVDGAPCTTRSPLPRHLGRLGYYFPSLPPPRPLSFPFCHAPFPLLPALQTRPSSLNPLSPPSSPTSFGILLLHPLLLLQVQIFLLFLFLLLLLLILLLLLLILLLLLFSFIHASNLPLNEKLPQLLHPLSFPVSLPNSFFQHDCPTYSFF